MKGPERPSFLALVIQMHLARESVKPRFGKRWIKYGQTIVLASYTFQIGGLLGAAFHHEPEPFLMAYSAPELPEESMHFVEARLEDVLQFGDSVRTLNDFVLAFEDKRVGAEHGSSGAMQKHGTKKLDMGMASFIAWEYGIYGASLGLFRPAIYHDWLDANVMTDPQRRERWTRMHEAGLAIPPQPDEVTYGQAERDALEMFKPFVSEYYPEFHSVLVPAPYSPEAHEDQDLDGETPASSAAAKIEQLMGALRASIERARSEQQANES